MKSSKEPDRDKSTEPKKKILKIMCSVICLPYIALNLTFGIQADMWF